jgi:aspartate ammonia-lyase
MRKEHDFLGELEIPNEVYYGIQTFRAIENFNISGIRISSVPNMIKGLGFVKKAAAMANRDLGVLDKTKAKFIIQACDEVIAGKFNDQFLSDVFQGGAGTSVNMNANEVIANRALELMGKKKGQYEFIHPNNDVNCSQSTNDAYPTAFRVALVFCIQDLLVGMKALEAGFAAKGKKFSKVLKMGRTQLQDAVPMTLGAEFNAFAENLREDNARLEESIKLLLEVNLGATAIGTSINAPAGYPKLATEYLAKVSGVKVKLARNLMEATYDNGAYVQLSGVLKRFAVKLSKICNDLRLLSSGPRAGFNEINLPPMQPGSSIMPGKVNPVIPEVVNQVCFQVIGTDVTITMAAEAGQLQLNVMEPVLAYNLFNNIHLLERACYTLQEKCIVGITANEEVCKNYVMNSIGIVTALNPIIGYENSASIAREALKTGKSVHQIAVLEKKLVTQKKWDEVYSVKNLINPQFIK